MPTPDPIDGEIVDETEALAEKRAYAVAMAARDPLALVVRIDTPNGGSYRTFIPRTDLAALDPNELWIGAYNKTGQVPHVDEFAPAANWSDEDRAVLGLPPRRHLLMAKSELAKPIRGADRVGLARMQDHHGILEATIAIRSDLRTTYVSHLTIGTRSRILTAVQLDEPLKVLGGHHLKFGIALEHRRAIEGHGDTQRLTD